jgi:hypothetical protein
MTMQFFIYRTTTGVIEQAQTTSCITTPEGILERIYGEAVPADIAALAADGPMLGKKVDLTTLTVVDDPDYVAPKPTLKRFEFKARFTQTERDAINASTDEVVSDFWAFINGQGEIDLNDSVVQGGIVELEALGLIATGRAAEIVG